MMEIKGKENGKRKKNTCLHAGKRKERRKLHLSFVVEWKM